MKRTNRALRVPTNFEPETRFEVKPNPAGLARSEVDSKLEELKGRLLRESLADVWKPEVRALLASSANEAAAVAWLTGFPLLVFPGLFAEKAETAYRVTERQYEIRERSRELLTV